MSAAEASGAPPMVASQRTTKQDVAEAPEVAADDDRPAASRPEAEALRPVAPRRPVSQAQDLAVGRRAVVLGIVLAVAVAAILMRQKPQDLAIKPPVGATTPLPPSRRRRSLSGRNRLRPRLLRLPPRREREPKRRAARAAPRRAAAGQPPPPERQGRARSCRAPAGRRC